MAYCTQTDLIAHFGQKRLEQLLIDTEGDTLASADPTAYLTEAIAVVDDEIDGALAPHYNVPLSTVPAEVRGLAVLGVFTHLALRRMETYTELDRTLDERYQKALAELRSGKRRIADLTISQGLPVAVGSLDPHSSRPYTEGSTDPDTINSGLTDPLDRY